MPRTNAGSSAKTVGGSPPSYRPATLRSVTLPAPGRWWNLRLWLGAVLRPHRIKALVLLFALLSAGPISAQPSDRGAVGEYQVKAAFLYHFAKFVEWPAEVKNRRRILVCVLGNDPFGPGLDFLLEDKVLREKPFEVRRVGAASEARICHLVFVSLQDKAETQAVLHTLSDSPVLTVGDNPYFFASGGMIHLFIEESKVRFDINSAAAKRVRLTISAPLLRLARRVEDK